MLRRSLFALAISIPLAAPCQSVVSGLDVAVAPVHGVDTVIFRRSVTRDGRDSISGTRAVVRRIVAASPNAQLLEVEQRFPFRGGEIIDTALADAGTMRATAHRSHQPKRTMRFEFVGDSALGAVTDSANRVEVVHQNIGGAIFDSNVLEFVVAGLPLAPNFSVTLPFFIYERGGRVMVPVNVVDRARVAFPALGGEREVWIVTLDLPGAPARIWIDTATRAVIRVRYEIAASKMSFTDERMTPLPS